MYSLRIVALGATLVIGLAATAAAQSTQGTEPGQERAAEAGGKGGRMRGPGRALLRGIELSETQRGQLKAIHQRYRPQHEALRARVRDSRQAGQRPDSTARAALRTEMRTLAVRQQTEVRAVLTPEQQRTFDANLARLRERGEGRAHRWRQGR